MKYGLLALMVSLTLGLSTSVFAAETAHTEHKAETVQQKAGDPGMMNHQEMMGKMDMGKMHAMMGDCMKMHKDGKKCDHQMMEQCQKNMDKGECSKMMKNMMQENKTK